MELIPVQLTPGDVDFLKEAIDFLVDILEQVEDDDDLD